MNGAVSETADSPGGSGGGSGARPPDEESDGKLLPSSDSPAPKRKNLVVRGLNKLLDIVNSTAVQTIMYIAFVYIFQTIAEAVRLPKLEYYFNKQIVDVFLDNHFDGSHNAFNDIRRVADIWEWGNTVLWSGFYSNGGPCTADIGDRFGVKGCNDDAWPDGEGSFHLDGATPYTVPELVRRMDLIDWTDGVVIKTARVQGTSPEKCTTHQLSGTCYPELKPFGTGDEEEASFGFNWTHPDEAPRHPWRYWSAEELGANPEGQVSAAIPSMRLMPSGGFAAFVIPFFRYAHADRVRVRLRLRVRVRVRIRVRVRVRGLGLGLGLGLGIASPNPNPSPTSPPCSARRGSRRSAGCATRPRAR